MSLVFGVVVFIIGGLAGGFGTYAIVDAMPDDPYGRCMWMAGKSKGGSNVRDCEPFSKDMTVQGKIENYKFCRETNKILKPDNVTEGQRKDIEIDCKILKADIKVQDWYNK